MRLRELNLTAGKAGGCHSAHLVWVKSACTTAYQAAGPARRFTKGPGVTDGADDTMMRTSGPGPRHDRALTLRSCWQRGEPRPDTCPRIGTSAQALLALPSGEGCRPGSSSRQDPASSLAPGRPVTLPPVTPQIQSQVKAWSLSPSKEPHEIFNSPFGK